jgi:hypothetical protein
MLRITSSTFRGESEMSALNHDNPITPADVAAWLEKQYPNNNPEPTKHSAKGWLRIFLIRSKDGRLFLAPKGLVLVELMHLKDTTFANAVAALETCGAWVKGSEILSALEGLGIGDQIQDEIRDMLLARFGDIVPVEDEYERSDQIEELEDMWMRSDKEPMSTQKHPVPDEPVRKRPLVDDEPTQKRPMRDDDDPPATTVTRPVHDDPEPQRTEKKPVRE